MCGEGDEFRHMLTDREHAFTTCCCATLDGITYKHVVRSHSNLCCVPALVALMSVFQLTRLQRNMKCEGNNHNGFTKTRFQSA